MLPTAMQFEVDRWLEQQGRSPHDWRVSPIISRGHSIARVWRLEPRGNDASSDSRLFSDTTSELGFAIRCWGRSSEHRASIENILFFQKAASLGLVESTTAWYCAVNEPSRQSIVPDVLHWTNQSWCFEHASTIWTIETWRPGNALDNDAIVTDLLLQQAFDVLDRLHSTGRRLGIQNIVAPGIIERSKRLVEWCSPAWKSRWKQIIDDMEKMLSSVLTPDRCKAILERTVDHLYRNEASLMRGLQRWLSSPVDCHWMVRDLWRENILVEKDRIAGIIDFGAARIDWPFLEIVRWISSWLSPDDPRIANLRERSAMLADADFRFFDHLATLLSLLQWFEWLLNDNISFEGRENQTRARIFELDRRLALFAPL